MAPLKKISKNIQQLTINNMETPESKVEWVNIVDAGKKELEYLRKKYEFEMSDLQPSFGKSISQRPVVRKTDGYLFIILHYPVIENGNITSAEVDFFVGHGFLITLHNDNLPALKNFFNLCKKDEKSIRAYESESSIVLLAELLEKLMNSCIEIIDENSLSLIKIEEMIFDQRRQNRAISHILKLRRNLTKFRKVVQSHKNILKNLMDMESSIVSREIVKRNYNGLVEYSKRIWEYLENQKEMVEIFYDTNESLLNNRLNDIMKTLTIFSVIVFPLTLLAAIFGMNTMNGMPFVNTDNGFWVIIVIMLTGSLAMLVFFWRKKWL